jgi:hypothetical protein
VKEHTSTLASGPKVGELSVFRLGGGFALPGNPIFGVAACSRCRLEFKS